MPRLRGCPALIRPFAERHHELIKFAIVGATTFIIDSAIFYHAQADHPRAQAGDGQDHRRHRRGHRVLHPEPGMELPATAAAANATTRRCCSSGSAVSAWCWPWPRCTSPATCCGLRVPEVSLTVENIADFISAYIIGNLLQMAFRFWAFRRWVFPDEFGRNPDKALESTLTAGGIAEAFEDHAEHHLGQSAGLGFEQTRGENTVTPLRRRVRDTDQLGDSSEPRVSKTS